MAHQGYAQSQKGDDKAYYKQPIRWHI